MQGPHPNPLHPHQTHIFPSFFLFLVFHSGASVSINLSLAGAFRKLPPPSHHLTFLKPLSRLSFNHVLAATAHPECSAVQCIMKSHNAHFS